MTDEQETAEASQQAPEKEEIKTADDTPDPVRRWTLIVAAVIVALLAWYLAAARLTPFTSQARVQTFVIPIAAEVAGRVVSVDVGNNDYVDEGTPLLRVDPRNYELAVIKAEADERQARQDVGGQAAGVDAAAAQVAASRANAKRAELDFTRMQRIFEEDPGAISVRRLESAESTYEQAKSGVVNSLANLDKTTRELGERDEENARLLSAQSALLQARINLERTVVLAPGRGLVTDLAVDAGNFAAAGQPLMTFIAIHDLWISADFTENNLGNVKPGDPVEIVLDVQPGKVYSGTVRNIGWGVSTGSQTLGALPTVDNDRNWLRDAQRFPVIVDLDEDLKANPVGSRVGSQADVIVYTGDGFLLTMIGKFYIRLVSLFSYAY
jgi:multidrug resistance efflux pump